MSIRPGMKPCVACGHFVDPRVYICPQCGRKAPLHTNFRRNLQNGILILLGLAVVYWCIHQFMGSLNSKDGNILSREGQNILNHARSK